MIQRRTKICIFFSSMLLMALLIIYSMKVQATQEFNGFTVENGMIVSYKGTDSELTIPQEILGQTITHIGNSAFKGNTTLEKVIISNSIVHIGNKAFMNCTELTEISLPTNLVSCGDYAFSGCSSLKSIELPGTLSQIGEDKGYVFNECTALEEVVIHEGVTNTGKYTFYKCTSLTSIVLPKTLKSFDVWAFGYCDSLINIYLPDNLERIDSAAFYGCSSIKEVIMPNTLSFLGTHSFRACSSLSNVQLSNNISTIPYRAFDGCSDLTSIVFPESLKEIDKEAFYQAGLENVNMSEGLIRIGEQAFYKCKKLENINFPRSIQVIEKGAFYACDGLMEVEFSDNIQVIKEDTFYGCSNIIKLVLPTQLTTIEKNAFYGCKNLIFIILPSNLEQIGEGAFEGCEKLIEICNLSRINLKNENVEIGSIMSHARCVHDSMEGLHIYQDDSGFVFYVSEEECLLISYQGAVSELVLPKAFQGTIYNIAEYAFRGNNLIKGIYIPEGITYIGNNAFDSCTNLYRVNLPKSLKQVGENAFSACSRLYRIDYEGSRTDWNEIIVGQNNDALSIWSVFFNGEKEDNIDEYQLNDSVQTQKKISTVISEIIANNIFVLNFLLTLFWGVILLYLKRSGDTQKNKQNRKLLFVVIVCLQWVLISSLRADTVGADTSNYMKLFDMHNKWTWKDIFKNIENYYSAKGVIFDIYEPGYLLLEKVIGTFSSNHIVYKFIIATIFMGAFGSYVYKNSDDPCLSFIIYDALFYNMFSLTGYRQVVSVAIGILSGFEFIKKRKFVPFIILILIASLFHKSTLVFILFYFLADKKLTRKYIISVATIVGVMVAFRTELFNYVKIIVGYEQYDGTYGFAQLTFTLLLSAMTIVVFMFKRQIQGYNTYSLQYYNGLILAWCMLPFAMVDPTSMRLVYDFGFVILLIIPTLARSFRISSNRIIVYSVIVSVLGFFIMTKSPEYYFFWQ